PLQRLLNRRLNKRLVALRRFTHLLLGVTDQHVGVDVLCSGHLRPDTFCAFLVDVVTELLQFGLWVELLVFAAHLLGELAPAFRSFVVLLGAFLPLLLILVDGAQPFQLRTLLDRQTVNLGGLVGIGGGVL